MVRGLCVLLRGVGSMLLRSGLSKRKPGVLHAARAAHVRARPAGSALSDSALRNKRRATLRLGPGLTTGACNDDPSSVGTYSQVGAQFGYGLAWTLLFSFPLLVTVQEISARMARVT